MEYLFVNGALIHYKVIGTGHPLVLIGGFTCDLTLWDPIVEDLAKYFQVLVFDNRGVGKTQDQEDNLSAELLAEDVMGLVRALGFKRPHVIGQSMGGTIAQKLACLYPDQIGKLGLLVTTAKWRKAMLISMIFHLQLRQISEDLAFRFIVPWIFGEKFLQDPQNFDLLNTMMAEESFQSIADQERQFKVLERFDGRNDLAQIRAPTLIMQGKEDLLSLPYESQFLASNISNARIESFDAGHGVILEDSHALVRSIITFFA